MTTIKNSLIVHCFVMAVFILVAVAVALLVFFGLVLLGATGATLHQGADSLLMQVVGGAMVALGWGTIFVSAIAFVYSATLIT